MSTYSRKRQVLVAHLVEVFEAAIPRKAGEPIDPEAVMEAAFRIFQGRSIDRIRPVTNLDSYNAMLNVLMAVNEIVAGNLAEAHRCLELACVRLMQALPANGQNDQAVADEVYLVQAS